MAYRRDKPQAVRFSPGKPLRRSGKDSSHTLRGASDQRLRKRGSQTSWIPLRFTRLVDLGTYSWISKNVRVDKVTYSRREVNEAFVINPAKKFFALRNLLVATLEFYVIRKLVRI